MKRPYRLLLVLLPALARAVVWWAVTPREPTYAGKPLSRWIAEIRAGDTNIPPSFYRSKTQREAIQTMGLEALPALLESVRARDYEPWWSVTYRWCLVRLPSALRQRLPAPGRLDSQREFYFQHQVILDCRSLRPQSEPLLIRTLDHPRPEVRATAAKALGGRTNTSPEVLSALTNRLRDPDAEVRRHVVDAIACFGPAASNAVPEIVENIRPGGLPARLGPSETEKAFAVIALGNIGSGAVAAIPVLQAGANQRTNAYFRITSAVAMWQIRHQAEDAFPALLQEFEASDFPEKWLILGCFGEMGTGAGAAVPTIITFLDSLKAADDSFENYNRKLALEALRKIAPDVAAKREREIEQLRRE